MGGDASQSLTKPILILGANGQVGKALKEIYQEKAIALGRDELDLSKPDTVVSVLEKYTPSVVINAAAYTQVDKAEEEEELAYHVNAKSPALIAKYCAEHDIPFIHYSTDYVFPGDHDYDHVWREVDPVSPVNVYGKTKLQGEEFIQKIGGKWIILRTSWVYDAYGKNFLNTMLRLGKERETLSVVNDQYGAPTYAPALAKATSEIVQRLEGVDIFPSSVYHLCGGGMATWHSFAEEIFAMAKKHDMALKIKNLVGITTSEYPTPAKRPMNSRLDCTKIKETLGVVMPTWYESLEECMVNVK